MNDFESIILLRRARWLGVDIVADDGLKARPAHTRYDMRTAFAFLALLSIAATTHACTNYLITPGATTDGSAFISYAADSGSLYGTLGFYPAADHPPNARRECYDWDSGKYLGSIPEAAHTYNVVGNVNEHQLTITETTFGGLGQFSSQKGAVIDYGSLIWITLQRAKTAVEAITVMDELMQKYGYASNGESFSIGDPNEVWIMEVMSKGEGELGSVWVAQKIPDGYVSGHANQARIRTFVKDDPSTSRFSHDVVDFARKHGLYNGTDADFSFSDTYDPVSFVSARMCECRVWNMFRQVAAESDFENQYLDYVKGDNLTNRMPLYIKPKEKISLNDTFWFMRGHYEGTYFDMSVDVGAGPFQSIYRARPLVWKDPANGKSYHNERPIGVQQTAWHLTSQMRKFLPNAIGTILWFGVDDTAHSVHVPFYNSVTRVSQAWADEGIQHVDDTKASLKVDFGKAWWMFNIVANYAYSRYNAISPVVQSEIVKIETQYFDATEKLEKEALQLINEGKTDDAVEMLTKFSENAGDDIVAHWLEFWKSLFFSFRDWMNTSPPPAPPAGSKDKPWPTTVQGGYAWKNWYNIIAEGTGSHYEMPTSANDANMDMLNTHKLKVLARKGL